MLYVAYYDEVPIDVKGKGVELLQRSISSAAGSRSLDDEVQTSLVYVQVPTEVGPFLVPFGEYDEWSLRDRHNEALRIMNTLGASEISCETFREVATHREGQWNIHLPGRQQADVEMVQEKVTNSSFDYRHSGAGGRPRDPRPLRWPNEPGFDAAVSAVLDDHATEVEFKIRSEHTHDINGKLGMRFKGCGFNLGGGGEHFGTTTLHIRATFPQIDALNDG